MNLIRAIHESQYGRRTSYKSHAPGVDGKPLCKLQGRGFGESAHPKAWMHLVGEAPTCKLCACALARQQGQGGAA